MRKRGECEIRDWDVISRGRGNSKQELLLAVAVALNSRRVASSSSLWLTSPMPRAFTSLFAVSDGGSRSPFSTSLDVVKGYLLLRLEGEEERCNFAMGGQRLESSCDLATSLSA